MAFSPQELAQDGASIMTEAFPADSAGTAPQPDLEPWVPLFRHECGFGPAIFQDVMMNMIKNPNLTSSWLFRADILLDEVLEAPENGAKLAGVARIPVLCDLTCKRVIVRKLIPRNTLRDKPLDQTCLVYEGSPRGDLRHTVIVYLPHVVSADEIPFYHPKVQGIAFSHQWSDDAESRGFISIAYQYFPDGVREPKLARTALNILSVVYKHGRGRASGYVKRVEHDTLVPQATMQNRYEALKRKCARDLVETWKETTDPGKHVFEDILIASFLMELWDGMYEKNAFPGFVDIGCGNGLLVYLLNQEGYRGWGFDARTRKSWDRYRHPKQNISQPDASQEREGILRQLVLLPSIVNRGSAQSHDKNDFDESMVHDGLFPQGTFIISNHADELTPWTPILAALSRCPFIMIPCCSHDLTGARFRAPPPKDKTQSKSAYSSLVSWVTEIAEDCGWEVEKEMLRIPSTRNTGLVGRKQTRQLSHDEVQSVLAKYGGTEGYFDNVVKLVKTAPRGH